ncbi:cyclin-like protein [Artemisia annua]|uniref:Cyclin-like protein n=1 Tax=Artemisia annua TaxID=35608 RepID=A0A2U1MM71_ARTAN|nr:cyclin-like protein [Artemisia annua]
MAILSPYSSSFLDTLFCNEDHHQWNLEDHEDQDECTQTTLVDSSSVHFTPFDQQDLCWDHEELVSLFTKEQEQQLPCNFVFDKTNPCVFLARKVAVEWILKVKQHYGFTPLAAILAINYFDRFVSSVEFKKDEPWMVQLVAVTCLSLAAKVEETQVPLLLDLQVEDSGFFFEAKNIQKMELLVMSALKWRMNPVTPISFLDHIVRRLGLTNHNNVHWDFFKKCEALILSLVKGNCFTLIAYFIPIVYTFVTFVLF